MTDIKNHFQFDDPLLPPGAAAKLLGLAKQTLAIWRHRGDKRLPWISLGRRAIRYRASDVRDFIERNRHATEPLVPPAKDGGEHGR